MRLLEARGEVRAAILLFGFAGALWAQFSGGVQVEVKDPSGAVLPNASVTIRSDAGTTRTATSDNAGEARFNELNIGSYQITITATGFANAAATVTVEPGKLSPVPVTWEFSRAKARCRSQTRQQF